MIKILGTAGYGSVASMASLRGQLDEFAELGGRWVDSATNYPMTGHSRDYLGTLSALSACTQELHLKVIVKVGSVENSGADRLNLSGPHISASYALLREMLGDSLGAIAVHWDSRTHPPAIRDTVDALRDLAMDGVGLGLSGIRSLETYARDSWARNYGWLWQINVRGPVDASGRSIQAVGIRRLFPNAKIVGYGFFGGIRPDPCLRCHNSGDRDAETVQGLWRRAQKMALDGAVLGTTKGDRLKALMLDAPATRRLQHDFRI